MTSSPDYANHLMIVPYTHTIAKRAPVESPEYAKTILRIHRENGLRHYQQRTSWLSPNGRSPHKTITTAYVPRYFSMLKIGGANANCSAWNIFVIRFGVCWHTQIQFDVTLYAGVVNLPEKVVSQSCGRIYEHLMPISPYQLTSGSPSGVPLLTF